MNKVILVGRLVRDPEVRYTQTSKAVASFTLAVNRRFSRNADSNQPTADFIPIVAWDKLGEICEKHLFKGSQVLVEGRLQIRSYDAQDGSKRYVTEVIANDIEFIGSKPTGNGPAANAGSAPASSASSGPAATFGAAVAEDEDIPF